MLSFLKPIACAIVGVFALVGVISVGQTISGRFHSSAPEVPPSATSPFDEKCDANEVGRYVTALYAPFYHHSPDATNFLSDELWEMANASLGELTLSSSRCVSLDKAVELTKAALPLFNQTIIDHDADLDRRTAEYSQRIAQADDSVVLDVAAAAYCELSDGLNIGGDDGYEFYLGAYWHSDLVDVTADTFRDIAKINDDPLYQGWDGERRARADRQAAEEAATSYVVGKKGPYFSEAGDEAVHARLGLPPNVELNFKCP